ncbi:MAG: hypothetical protein M3R12_06665 [Actinomycetota bacterium]|nr:hypothetical protein [Actinomycetota bacterium]
MRFRLAALIAVLAAVALPGAASASEIIDRDASNVSLKVAKNGQALISFDARGKRWNVLAWGAVNALHPTTARAQLKFRLDYSGGYGTYKRDVWKTFKNACRSYDGPELQWVVQGCKAPDGSYWVLQAWQRALPNYGLKATPEQAVWELRLSHFSGEIPVLTVHLNWAYRKFHHLFGEFTYLGKPVHGFKSTAAGVPLDTFGRNLYLDTFDSAYGKGWLRENSFLMHKGTGKFCYGFYQHGNRPEGKGTKYRATIIGPGVLPDIYWEADALTEYDKDFDLQMHETQKQFYVGDSLCRAV